MAIIDNLKMSEEAMQTAITDFKSRKQALENSYLKISNEARTLTASWHGEASRKFTTQFDALYKNLAQNETVMENVIDKVSEALNLYVETENEAEQMLKSLEEGMAYIANNL